MQHESTTQKKPAPTTESLTKEHLHGNSRIRLIRSRVILLVTIELVLIIFYFVIQFLKVITATGLNAEPDMNRFTISVVSKFIGAIIAVIIFIIIIKAVKKYNRKCILAFAWLFLFGLIGTWIIIICSIIEVIDNAHSTQYSLDRIFIAVLSIVIESVGSVFAIFTFIVLFELATLIKIQTNGQII